MQKIIELPKKIFRFALDHKILSAIFIVVILILIIFLRPKNKIEVITEKVSQDDLVQSLAITGSIEAERTVNLTFQVGGKLSWLGVKKGDTVYKGQTLATLDQRTALKNLQSSLIDYSKQRNVFEQANLDQQAIKPADALNDKMKKILQNNQYDLDKTVLSVDLQELAREESVLTTPIAGIITRADAITSGTNITPTTTFTVTDPTSLTFVMEVDEADISKISSGQPVEATLNSFADHPIQLSVSDIDFVTHTTSTGGSAYNVKAQVPENLAKQYRVGMNGNATIITGKKSNVIRIPLSSLIDDNTVYIQNGKTYEKRKLLLGIQNDTEVEVIKGLNSGENLVLNPDKVPIKK